MKLTYSVPYYFFLLYLFIIFVFRVQVHIHSNAEDFLNYSIKFMTKKLLRHSRIFSIFIVILLIVLFFFCSSSVLYNAVANINK